MSIKLLYIVSDIDKALAFEWVAQALKKRFDLSFILISKKGSILEGFLKNQDIPVYCISNQVNWLKIWKKIFQLVRYIRPDTVHTHLEKASFLGLSASRIAGVKTRIHTRHHSTMNYRYSKKSILIDLSNNVFSNAIIAPSKNIKNVLVKNELVSEQKVNLIHHGFKFSKFLDPSKADVDNLYDKYHVKAKYPVIGIIARWDELKGIQFVIAAFKRLIKDHPDALLILANANGPFPVKDLLDELPKESYRIIKFEEDLYSLYQLFDIYIHVPIDQHLEGFGQTYVEALAAGIPSIFTLSGVASEFIKHEENALVVPYKDSNAIYQSIVRLLEDKNLSALIVENGRNSLQQFSFERMISKLESLYKEAV